jgi:hypothetical protein
MTPGTLCRSWFSLVTLSFLVAGPFAWGRPPGSEESRKSAYVAQAEATLASWRETTGSLRRERARAATDSERHRELDERIGRLEEALAATEAALQGVREADPGRWTGAKERFERRMALLDALPEPSWRRARAR